MSEKFPWLDILMVPLFWVNNDDVITWSNVAAQHLLGPQQSTRWSNLRHHLPEGYIYHIHEGSFEGNAVNSLMGHNAGFLVECIPDATPGLALANRELREINEQLEIIFQEAFDEVYVADGNGVTVRVNKATERLYGMSQADLIGRSVFELEREGVFYPSVIAMVIQQRTPVTILQTTKDGKRLITTATPVFDTDGQLQFVISTAKDMAGLPLVESQIRQQILDPRSSAPVSPIVVTKSPKMLAVMSTVKRLAHLDAILLLLGETGVGKNLLAEHIHRLSKRQRGPFVDVNCATIPESLLESELFGYEAGAFTGALRSGKAGKVEVAHGGTLFLNEVGEIPLHLQGKLLDLIQERTIIRVGSVKPKKVDIRIIAATNRNLSDMVRNGLFRADLYYRLNVVPIEIPPLRQRSEDIPQLADGFLQRWVQVHHLPARELSSQTLVALSLYSWPGNVRELENLMERLALTVEESLIEPHHLPPYVQASPISEVFPTADVSQPYLDSPNLLMEAAEARVTSSESPLRWLEWMELRIYEDALRKYPSTYKIADALGVSQPTVVRKLKQFGLRP